MVRGTHNIQKATWKQAERTLKRLGATKKRQSSNHNHTIFELPGGKKITTNKRMYRNHQISRIGLTKLFDEITRAGIDPALASAILITEGATYYKLTPQQETLLQQIDKRTRLRTLSAQRKILATITTLMLATGCSPTIIDPLPMIEADCYEGRACYPRRWSE